MRRLASYLTFNGNCREAMEFYQGCLGGHLSIQLVGDMPGGADIPDFLARQVVHCSLVIGRLMLCGTDMRDTGTNLADGAISLWLECDDEAEIKKLYIKLSSGGIQNHPPSPTYWGGWSGDLTDRYGNKWLLQYTKTNK